jgi:hypothetical protein
MRRLGEFYRQFIDRAVEQRLGPVVAPEGDADLLVNLHELGK